MAIMHRPALLIADEATSALSTPITQSEILELFARLNREIGHVDSLHLPRSAFSGGICQRIAILHEGEGCRVRHRPDRFFTAPVHRLYPPADVSFTLVPVRREVLLASPRRHAGVTGGPGATDIGNELTALCL